MFARLIKFEFKNLLRDRMTAMLLTYPLMVGFLGKYLFENDTFDENGIRIMIVALSIVSGVIFGSMSGFSILDDRDDHVFVSIRISPLDIRIYVWFKVIFVYIMSVFSNLLIYWIVGGFGIDLWLYVIISMLLAMQVPIHAFIVNALASNKVEGFMAMKGSGFLMIFPIGALFFLDWKEWLFALAPAFWGAKAVQYELLKPAIDLGLVEMNLSTFVYLGIGFVYNIVLIAVLYKVFEKKAI